MIVKMLNITNEFNSELNSVFLSEYLILFRPIKCLHDNIGHIKGNSIFHSSRLQLHYHIVL